MEPVASCGTQDLSGRLPHSNDRRTTDTISRPTAWLETRISTELHAMFKRVAENQGHTLTEFVVSAVQKAAQRRASEQSEVVRLSLADSERFAQVILPSPAPRPGSLGAHRQKSRSW